MKNKILIIVGAVIIVGFSFFGGMKYGESKTSNRFAGAGMMQGRTGGQFGGGNRTAGGARGAGGFTAGQILSKDATSITVKLSDGGSKIVFYSPSTTVTKSASTTIDTVNVNDSVFVTGSANADGSINASNIQVGGGSRMMGGAR